MFTVIYSFKVKPNREDQFIESWKRLTELIYEFEGSLGSRLHKEDDLKYVAYAQWPNKDRWENFGQNMPDSSKAISKRMKEACNQIKTTHQLDVVIDLLKK